MEIQKSLHPQERREKTCLIVARESSHLFFCPVVHRKYFTKGHFSYLEVGHSSHRGSPFEARGVPDSPDTEHQNHTGKPEHTRPRSSIQLRGPAALQGPKPENVREETLLQGPKFNQLEVFLNNHPIHIFKINCASFSKQSAFH